MQKRARRIFVWVMFALSATSCQPPAPADAEKGKSEAEPRKHPHSKPRGTAILQGPSESADSNLAARLMERERTPSGVEAGQEDQLMAEYGEASAERKAEILAAIGAGGDPETWDFLCQAAGDPEAEVRLAALDALAMHGGGDPSKAILGALTFPDEETKALAASLLSRRARDTKAWSAAATESSVAVRVAYLSAVEDAPIRIRLSSARAALERGDPQLRKEAASVLGGAASKEAVELLIPLLDDQASSDVASDSLFFLIGEHFDSSQEARVWWEAKRLTFEFAPE